jgi:hypothetical protein
MSCFSESYKSSFTPKTTVRSALFDGALIITLETLPPKCFEASSLLLKAPVHSRIISISNLSQGILEGSFS